jgi:hypothetical protein
MSSPHHVSIVTDRSFAERLPALARRLHVWLCRTPDNERAAKEIWAAIAPGAFSLDSGVTLFDVGADQSPAQMLLGILDVVTLHHGEHSHEPPWSVIEVVGCPLTEDVREAFAEHGATVEADGVLGFVARRSVPPTIEDHRSR